MIEIISGRSDGIGNEPVSAEERLYVSTTLGWSFRSFEGEVQRSTVRFEERRSGGHRCTIEVETREASVQCEAQGPSRVLAFSRATEALDRRIFGAVYGSLRHAA